MRHSRARRRLLIAGGVLLGLWALAYAFYLPSVHRARARIGSGSRMVSSRCGRIEYAEAGSGTPVLVVHGAGGGFDQGLALGEGLARAGFRVIAPSRFGYLRTPLPADASLEAQAAAHACLLDALQVSGVAIVGVSAGGPSALRFAVRFPDRTRALVLLVPAVYSPHPGPGARPRASRAAMVLFDSALRSDFAFWLGSKLARPSFIRSILATPPELVARAPAEEQARINAVLDQLLPVTARRLGLVNDARVVSSLRRDDLEDVAAPTLAISTSDDGYHTLDGAQYTAQHVPHARLIVYPDGGHMLVGRNAAATAEIVAFLRGAGGGGAAHLPAGAKGPGSGRP